MDEDRVDWTERKNFFVKKSCRTISCIITRYMRGEDIFKILDRIWIGERYVYTVKPHDAFFISRV